MEKEKINILALDLGTKTGWALYDGNQIFHGVENFANSRYSGGGMRFLKFKYFLDSIKQKSNIDYIYFEEVRRHISTDSAHVYGGFLATLTSWCEDNNIAYEGVPVGTIKLFIAGKGNASKENVINSVRNKGFIDIKDDNEADALALLLYAIGSVKI